MIGVFDSGYGGLTVLESIRQTLPDYDYLYLGDNARNPYGTRSFEVVYKYTLQGVEYLFNQGCRLVILACNTASAKALRTIQQNDLPRLDPTRRVLGVIRPTAEIVGKRTLTRHIGILATEGTVRSRSYVIETAKLFPDIQVTQQACPMWVPLIENNEHTTEGARFFIEKYIRQLSEKDPLIDTIILGCTHYPIIQQQITAALSVWEGNVKPQIIAQGDIVAQSLKDYLTRHNYLDTPHQTHGTTTYLTTENADKFNKNARLFLNEHIEAQQITLS